MRQGLFLGLICPFLYDSDMKFVLILTICLVSLCAFAAEPTVIRFGVNSDYAMPLIQVSRKDNNPKLEAGILKDLGEALAAEMNMKVTWILLPKKRVAPNLLSGEISLICHVNEVWQPAIKDAVEWSHDLYRSTNVIVHTKKNSLRSIKDLYGERVGTVLNFVYTNLDKHFAKGEIKRENGPNNESNVQKLLHDRINYVVMSNLEFNYYKRIYPQLDFVDFGLDIVMTKCAVSKKSTLNLNQLNKAIDSIKKNGTLDRILKSY